MELIGPGGRLLGLGERMKSELVGGAHPVVGAALSMVVPGAGQAYAGRPYRAVAFLGGILVFALAGWAWLMWNADPLAALLEPGILGWVLAIDLGLLAYRSWSVVDAYRLRSSRSPAGVFGLVIILAITALPHVGLAYAQVSVTGMVGRVFEAGEPGQPPPAGTVPAPVSSPSTTVAETATEAGGHPPRTNTTVGEPVTSSTVANSSAEREERTPAASASQTFEPVSILLLGGDAGPGRPGLRTDVIDVVTFIPATGRAALFGIPRNFGSVPLPDTLAGHYPGGVFDDLINALYEDVEAAPGPYIGSPNPGAAALEDTIGQLLGIDIEHHALVDMGGFVDVIDALGGVTIDVPAPIVVRLSPPKEGEGYRQYNIPVGVQHVDGHQALAYVRSRTGSNDYDRMARQRCVLAALAEQVGALDLLTAVPRLAAALEAHVSTDVPIDLLPALVRVAGNINSSDVITLRFVPPDYTAGRDTRGQLIPDTAGIRAAVQAILSNLEDGSQPLTSGATAGTACAWDG